MPKLSKREMARKQPFDAKHFRGLSPEEQERERERFYKTFKLERPQERTLQLDVRNLDLEKRTVELSCSSEAPVDQWYGIEILSHDQGAVILDRFKARAPYLVMHEWDDQVGVIEDALIRDKKLVITVRFSKSDRGNEIFNDIADGIRPNVSIGYVVYAYEEVTQKGDAGRTFRATSWEPFEASTVSVPADITVGVGRQMQFSRTLEDSNMFTPEQIAGLKAARAAGRTLTAEENAAILAYDAALATRAAAPSPAIAPAAQPAAVDAEAAQRQLAAERTRVSSLRSISERFTAPEHQEAIRKAEGEAITSGEASESFMARMLELTRSRPVTATIVADPSASQSGYRVKDLQKYSILRVVRMLSERQALDGLELEVHQEELRQGNEVRNGGIKLPLARIIGAQMEASRVMNTNSGSAGGYLVDTKNMGMVELLRNKAALPQLGVTMLEGLVGDVAFSRQTAAGTTYWVGQSTDITLSDQTLGQLLLTPKTVGAATRITRKLMRQSSPSAEVMVQNDILKVLGLAIDLAAISGSGVSGQPLGLMNISGPGSVTGTSIALAGILKFESDVASANADVSTMKFLTTPGVRALLKARQRFTSTDTPLWDKDDTINGYGAVASNQSSSASMIFGDWSQLILALWGSLELKIADQGAGYLAGDVDLIAFQDCDVACKQTGAFSIATSIT